MQKRSYFDNFLYSVKKIKENPVLYLPDLIFIVFTLILTILFLYLNNLTSIFSGLDLFKEKIKDIIFTKSSLVKLLVSLAVFIIINLLIGLGTIATRYILIKMAVKNEKVSFGKAYKETKNYVLPILGLKLTLLGIYLLPLVVFLGVGLVYKKLLLLMLVVLLFAFLMIRFAFLFTYAVLFLKTGKGVVGTIRESLNYFNNNKKHAILTGIFTGVVGFAVTVILNSISKSFSLDLISFSAFAIIFFVIKTFIDITLIIWSNLFIFKNY